MLVSDVVSLVQCNCSLQNKDSDLLDIGTSKLIKFGGPVQTLVVLNIPCNDNISNFCRSWGPARINVCWSFSNFAAQGSRTGTFVEDYNWSLPKIFPFYGWSKMKRIIYIHVAPCGPGMMRSSRKWSLVWFILNSFMSKYIWLQLVAYLRRIYIRIFLTWHSATGFLKKYWTLFWGAMKVDFHESRWLFYVPADEVGRGHRNGDPPPVRASIVLARFLAIIWKSNHSMPQTPDIFSLADAAWIHPKYPRFCILPPEFGVNIDIHKHENCEVLFPNRNKSPKEMSGNSRLIANTWETC